MFREGIVKRLADADDFAEDDVTIALEMILMSQGVLPGITFDGRWSVRPDSGNYALLNFSEEFENEKNAA